MPVAIHHVAVVGSTANTLSDATREARDKVVSERVQYGIDKPSRAFAQMPIFTKSKPNTNERHVLFDNSTNNLLNMVSVGMQLPTPMEHALFLHHAWVVSSIDMVPRWFYELTRPEQELVPFYLPSVPMTQKIWPRSATSREHSAESKDENILHGGKHVHYMSDNADPLAQFKLGLTELGVKKYMIVHRKGVDQQTADWLSCAKERLRPNKLPPAEVPDMADTTIGGEDINYVIGALGVVGKLMDEEEATDSDGQNGSDDKEGEGEVPDPHLPCQHSSTEP
ncbi:hypothetical protein H4S08_004059 [Coemansia sp. RSA 1365]|nr:hypothetical protein H4S08_004059 [Coemansia sp. RSA 1365]